MLKKDDNSLLLNLCQLIHQSSCFEIGNEKNWFQDTCNSPCQQSAPIIKVYVSERCPKNALLLALVWSPPLRAAYRYSVLFNLFIEITQY